MRANIECDVRHVGGTAIPGMCSKPIVDVLVTVDSEDMEIAPHALAREFCCLGECGRPGRYFFSDGDTEDDAVYIHLTTAANQVARLWDFGRWLSCGDFETIKNRLEKSGAFSDDDGVILRFGN